MKSIALLTLGYMVGVIAPHAWSPVITGALLVLTVATAWADQLELSERGNARVVQLPLARARRSK